MTIAALVAALAAWTTPALAQGEGPVAAYAFSESSGALAVDWSSAGTATGTLQGATRVSGRFGGGLQMDGLDDSLQLASFDSLTLTSAFTVEAWIAPSALGHDRSIWWTPAVQLTLRADGTLVPVAILSGGQVGFVSMPALSLDAWAHVAVTYDGSMLRLYVDGVDAGSRPATGTLVAPVSDATIVGGASAFAGKIDEVRLYRRALSEIEIRVDAATPLDAALPLEISARTPAANAVGVTQSAITITFSRAVDARTITASTFELRDSQNLVTPGAIAYDPAIRQATLLPAAALAPLSSYTVYVRGGSLGVRDALGMPLAADIAWSFRTAASAAIPSAIYSFSDASAGMSADTSGNGNDAALLNAPVRAAGRVGGGLQMDGADDAVQLPLTQSLTLTNAFTVEAWIAPAAFGRDRSVWWTPAAMLTLRADGTFMPVAILSGGQVGFLSDASVPLGTWSHVAMTYNGSTLRLYINGADAGSRPASGALVPLSPPQPGLLGGTAAFAGSIDEVRIYRRALTAAEVAADMTVPDPVVTPFVVTTTTPADLGLYVTGSRVSATFNRPALAASLTTATVQLRNSANQLVAAAVAYDGTTNTVTLTPAVALTASATYYVRIAGGTTGVQAEGAGQLASDVQWSFRTPAAVPPPSSLLPHIDSVDIVLTWFGPAMVVSGSNFGERQGTSTVTIAGKAATVAAWCNDTILAFLPRGVSGGSVVVKVDGKSSNSFTASKK